MLRLWVRDEEMLLDARMGDTNASEAAWVAAPELLAHLEREGLSLSIDETPWMDDLRRAVASVLPGLALPNGGPAPRIDVAAIDRPGFGGRADVIDAARHHYAILLNEDSLVGLADTSFRALSHPNCFTDIGDPSLERFPDDGYGGIEARRAARPNIPVPRCPIRKAYANFLTVLSVRTMGFHEYGHIVQGHLRLLSSGYTATREQRLAIEVAADYYASIKLAQWARAFARSNRPDFRFPVDEIACLEAAARASYLCHMLDEAAALHDIRRQPSIYPPPRQRQLISLYGLEGTYEHLHQGSIFPSQRIGVAVAAAESAYQIISQLRADFVYVKESLESVPNRDYLRTWQLELRPKLESLTYAELMTAGENGRPFVATA